MFLCRRATLSSHGFDHCLVWSSIDGSKFACPKTAKKHIWFAGFYPNVLNIDTKDISNGSKSITASPLNMSRLFLSLGKIEQPHSDLTKMVPKFGRMANSQETVKFGKKTMVSWCSCKRPFNQFVWNIFPFNQSTEIYKLSYIYILYYVLLIIHIFKDIYYNYK